MARVVILPKRREEAAIAELQATREDSPREEGVAARKEVLSAAFSAYCRGREALRGLRALAGRQLVAEVLHGQVGVRLCMVRVLSRHRR